MMPTDYPHNPAENEKTIGQKIGEFINVATKKASDFVSGTPDITGSQTGVETHGVAHATAAALEKKANVVDEFIGKPSENVTQSNDTSSAEMYRFEKPAGSLASNIDPDSKVPYEEKPPAPHAASDTKRPGLLTDWGEKLSGVFGRDPRDTVQSREEAREMSEHLKNAAEKTAGFQPGRYKSPMLPEDKVVQKEVPQDIKDRYFSETDIPEGRQRNQ